ncbi:unnamed protein product [Closterium sp. Naga37s-1]|nr:unnamed protein product [Closterium sp. Naga37s-1]
MMGHSKLFLILLALSLVVSLALVPLCRADEIIAEDDAIFDANVDDDTEISAASEPGFLSKLFGGTRRFLWSPQAHRMLHSCKQKCEKKNKKCNTDYSKCKRKYKDDKEEHEECTDDYKKCKRKAKKCRSKCD